MCDVAYKPSLGVVCKALVVSIRNPPLLFALRFIDSDGYKLGGVHWELATTETT